MKAKNMEHNSANFSNITGVLNKNLCFYWKIWFFFRLSVILGQSPVQYMHEYWIYVSRIYPVFKKAISSSTYFWMTKWRKSTAGLTDLSQASSTNSKLPFWNSLLKVRYGKTARWKEALGLLWHSPKRRARILFCLSTRNVTACVS